MFHDDEPSSRVVATPARSAELRYHVRVARFRGDGSTLPRVRHAAHWVFHNAVVHPLIGLLPCWTTSHIHDLSSAWLNKQAALMLRDAPKLSGRRLAWLWHNCVAHPLIALFPCSATFAHHDRSAERMKVRGWL